jgi:hypothetical protein
MAVAMARLPPKVRISVLLLPQQLLLLLLLQLRARHLTAERAKERTLGEKAKAAQKTFLCLSTLEMPPSASDARVRISH